MMLAQLSRDCKRCIRIIRLLGSSAMSLTRRDRWQSSSKVSARRDCNRPSAIGSANGCIWQILLQKSVASGGGQSVMRPTVTGFDLPALTPLRNSDATQCTGLDMAAPGQPVIRAAAGSGRWRREQTRPGRLAGLAIEADRASGYALGVRTASRSSCAPALIARTPRSLRGSVQYPERLRADRAESFGRERSDSTAL